jgi:polysaccharide export outer membrane protein
MKQIPIILTTTLLLVTACTSQKKLAYLNNLSGPNSEETFTMDIPVYKIQPRDILFISAKAMTPDGMITDYLSSGSSISSSQDESGAYLYSYVVNKEGLIIIPAIGVIKVGGLTLDEIRIILQSSVERVFKNSTVECKLQSYRYTVIGEAKAPGTFMNYGNYLTILEAIGRAGGIGDYGDRRRILVIRTFDKGTKTFTLNLQDKKILSSEGYFLLPNDVVIIQPLSQKIFNMNLPTIAFMLSTFTTTLSTTLLLIFFFKK